MYTPRSMDTDAEIEVGGEGPPGAIVMMLAPCCGRVDLADIRALGPHFPTIDTVMMPT